LDDIKRNIQTAVQGEANTFHTEYNRIDSLMIDLGRLISNPAALDTQMSPVKQRIQDLQDRVQATERKTHG